MNWETVGVRPSHEGGTELRARACREILAYLLTLCPTPQTSVLPCPMLWLFSIFLLTSQRKGRERNGNIKEER